MPKKKKPLTRNQRILWGMLIVAIVSGIVVPMILREKSPPTKQMTATGSHAAIVADNNSVVVTGQADSGNQISDSPFAMAEFQDNQFRDLNITFSTNNRDTQLAIEALQQKVDSTSSKIELTRNEVSLLARALKDLDDRTSGIEKLPDGRTKFGHLVSGKPHFVLAEHQAAIQAFNAKKYRASLEHSKKAIEAFNASQNKGSIDTGNLSPENRGKLYVLGVLSADKIGDPNLVKEWSKKALALNPKLAEEKGILQRETIRLNP